MLKNIVVFILLVFGSNIYAQTIISGIVKDSVGRPLFMANIIIKHQGKILGYTTSNEQGKFEIKVKAKDNYKVKATFLGYKPIVASLTSKDNLKSVILVLYELKTQLTEVIINSDIPDFIQKRDTILYNLSRLTDGNESTLKDIIEKLPGMEIDRNGKIKVNGKPIDKVLINGKNFFNKQHQLATENINSDMVKTIAFYKNFKTTFDTRTDVGIRAIDVTIKDKYSNKITGNLTTSGSYDKKYKLHPNIFNFRKNANIAFIGNINSFGNQAITLTDYMTFTGGVKRYIKNVRPGDVEIDEENIPEFLLKEDEVADRKVYFSGINLVFQKPKKYSFSGFYLVNFLQQSESITTQKDYWDNLSVNETSNVSGDYFIITTYSHFKYKIAKSTILKWLVTSSLQNDNSKSSLVQNNLSSNQDLKSKYKNLGSNLSITQTFKNDIEWNGNFILDYIYQNKDRFLTANYPVFDEILSNSQNNVTYQNQKEYFNTNISTKLTKYYKHSQYTIAAGYNKDIKDYKTISKYSALINDLQLKNNDYFSNLEYKYNSLAWHLKGILSYHYLNTALDNKNQTLSYLSPSIHITYLFSINQSISGGYSYSRNKIAPQKLLSNNTITDANSVYYQSLVKNTLLPTNQFYINYDNYIKKIKLYISINGNYTQKEKTVNSSIKKVTSKATYLQYRLFPAENKWNASYAFNKKITKHLLLSYKGNYSLENRTVYNTLGNRKLTVSMFNHTLKLYSKRKKSRFNYSFGLKHKLYQTSYQNNTNNHIYITYTPFINLNGYFAKKYFWHIKSSYESYRNIDVKKYTKISSSLEYRMNKKFNIALIAHNVFNIGRNKIIQWNTNEQFSEQISIAHLPGYISFQLKVIF